MPTGIGSCGSSSPGSSPSIGNSEKIPTFRPSTIRADTSFARSISRIANPFSFANTSTANFPCRSVAVVMTGSASRILAASSASALAPPRCPDRREITNFPCSSMTRTAGSVFLSCTNGAMLRTAIPQAPIKISASASRNILPVQSFRGSCRDGSSGGCAYLGIEQPTDGYPASESFLHRI